ncbi:hypothetical protein [Brevundimonas aveniformis]|uniref:hypothetical protein n=1 Tax=Brevundimonas aveniformis TaxID=370977 RepID=UPI0004921B1E|nr:hypothetical protein [Brevundimonas aveniformis]
MTQFSEYGSAIARGLVDGWRQYHLWTRDPNIHAWGIEPFLSVKVAQALYEASGGAGWVTLETPIAKLHEWSGASTGRVADSINKSGRVDVAFYNRLDRLRGLVEVKRHFGFSGLKADSHRLVAMLDRFGKKHEGSVRWVAVCALHLTLPGKKPAEARMADAAKKFRTEFPKLKVDTYSDRLPRPKFTRRFEGCPEDAVGLCILLRP